jgi:hypothetical protein
MVIKSILPEGNILRPWEVYMQDFRNSTLIQSTKHPILCRCGHILPENEKICTHCSAPKKLKYRLRVFNIRRQLSRIISPHIDLFDIDAIIAKCVNKSKMEYIDDCFGSPMFFDIVNECKEAYKQFDHICFLNLSADGFLV